MNKNFILIFYALFIFTNFYTNAQQDAVSNLLVKDVCPSLSATVNCNRTTSANYTVVVTEALYGIKKDVSDLCEYKDGDCYTASTSSFCPAPSDSCGIYPSSTFKVPNCQNQLADYLHVRYRCVPATSSSIKNNNICADNTIDITDEAGFISSPSYPTYTIVSNECTRRITVPSNKLINMWLINDFKSADFSTDICLTDYLKITDSTGAYVTCGYRKYSFESKFCSSSIYISYKAPSSLSTAYRGFRIYYETVDRSTQPDCSTETPASPTPVTTPTTPPTTTKPPQYVIDNVASGLFKVTACKGEEKSINIPSKYNLIPLDVYYGITSDLTCNTIGPQNCRSPATLNCLSSDSCKLSLTTNIILPDCGNKIANYIGAEYRFIPVISSKNYSICDSNDINATTTSTSAGIISSPSYPNFQISKTCQRKILAPAGKQIRLFLSDIKIEPQVNNDCSSGYVSIITECGITKICGDKSNLDSNIFLSCTNIISIQYVSTNPQDVDQLRGFNFYYEIVTPDSASAELALGACSGSYVNAKCDSNPTTNFTVFFSEALYGVKSVSTNPCEYRDGDCYEPYAITSCLSTKDSTCSVYASTFNTLSSCQGKRPDYLFTRFNCIPSYSTLIKDYNICDKTLSDLTDGSGFISSPSFPTYISVNTECQVKIRAPANKLIKIWLYTDIKYDSTGNCPTDYVKITDTTGTYKGCSYKKYSFDKQLCSNVVYVSYLAPSSLSATLYNGFRLYYEFADRSTQPDCITGTPQSPTTPTTTTTTPQVVFDLSARPTTTVTVCRGNETTIQVPKNFTLFPVDLYYGVTQAQNCKNISSTDCKSPAKLTCSFNDNCKISFYNDISINDCGGRLADYISLQYRLIPPISLKNASICDNNNVLNLTSTAYGVLTSTNYPTYISGQACARTLQVPVGKLIKLYVTDINIPEADQNGQCNNGYLEFKSSCQTIKYCGTKPDSTSHAAFIFTSCTNSLTVTYNSGNSNSNDLKGFNVYYEATIGESATPIEVKNACGGDTISLSCDSTDQTKFSPYVSESFYGLKSNVSQGCKYVPGDCIDAPSNDFCFSYSSTTCSIFSSSFKTLPNCQNKYADYINVRHRCVPYSSTKLKYYPICSDFSTDITESSGFIQSPNFPTYQIVPNECTRKIVAPNDKIIKLWVVVDMRSGSCADDYFKITDNTGTYTGCGYRKYAYDYQLCSSVVYVSYKAPSNLSPTLYKGMQIYYEFADRITQPDCPTNTPGSPTTTLPTTTTKPSVIDLSASQVYKSYACLGNQTTIQIPKDFKLYPLKYYYGVTKDGTCKISAQDCKSPAVLSCSLEGSCSFSLFNDVPVADCGETVIANYIGLEYRFIPFVSSKNLTVCDATQVTISNQTSYGIITNPNYPNWEPNKNCNRKLTAPNGKIIRVYVNDFNIEKADNDGVCRSGYIRLKSDCSNVTLCGEKSLSADYVFETCTSNLEISYVSTASTPQSSDYRGFNIYYEVTVKDLVSALYTEDICTGNSKTVGCESTLNTNFTVFLYESINGVKSGNKSCIFNQNDCLEAVTSPGCTTPSITATTCYQYASSFTTLSSCSGKTPDYMHLRYKCVPIQSVVIPTYNICDNITKEVTNFNGFIQSPNYPTYQSIPNGCSIKITAPSNKIIKIWVLEIDIKSSFDSNANCATDYIQITDNTGSYKICGYKKQSFENQLCSSVIYVTYMTPALLSTSVYHGMKIYYEFIDRSTQPSCSSATPGVPTLPPTTTQTTTPRPLVNNLSASNIFKAYACKGTSATITVPVDYQLFPINVYYGVTPNGTCVQSQLNQLDCRSPAQLTCSLQGSCIISLLSDISIDDCDGKMANYIGVDYRLIPLVTTKNSTICDNTDLILNATSSGVITSPGYPTFQTNINCNRKLVAPADRIIRVYVNDLFIDYPEPTDNSCQKSSLTLQSSCGSMSYCGEKTPSAGYEFNSCGNNLTIQYKSSNTNTFRGFNLYYEVTLQDSISPRLTKDICAGSTVSLTCDTSINTNFTVLVSEVLNSVKPATVTTNKCVFNETDCSAVSTTAYCTSTLNTCSQTTSFYTTVTKCNDKYADYYHFRYRCVPFTSNVIREFNVCDKSKPEITDANGLISSPNYPTFKLTDEECTMKIKAPSDKIILIWLPDVYIKSPESNNDCLTDYVKLTHNTGVIKACGNKKFNYENRLCSSEVIVNYKVTTSSSSYRGFKLYYEFIDRSTQPNCPTELPTTPQTTPFRPPTQPQINNLAATEIKKEYICKGSKTTLKVPTQYNLFVIDYYYGVTVDGTCNKFSEDDCKSPAEYPCSTDSDCDIQFYNNIELDDCGGKSANYIGLEYRNIPLYSSKNNSICEENKIDLTDSSYGIITSPNYPNWKQNTQCRTSLTAPPNKNIRVYINDLNTEPANDDGRCRTGALVLESSGEDKVYCGEKAQEGEYIFISCSNRMEIYYTSSGVLSTKYRGFNLYYEVIDNQNLACPNVTRSTYVRTSRTTRYESLIKNDSHKSSKHLTGWSLGIGLPLVVIIIFAALYMNKRMNSGTGSTNMTFSRLKNSENYSNPNFS